MSRQRILFSKEQLNDSEVQSICSANTRHIEEILENFKSTNGLSNTDFLVLGSSAMHYLGHLMLGKITDVDVLMLTDKDVERTEGIDLLDHIVKLDEYDIQTKNGYQFISKDDFLITSGISVLYKWKKKDAYYIRVMLRDMDITLDDYISSLEERLQDMDYSRVESGRKESLLADIGVLRDFLM